MAEPNNVVNDKPVAVAPDDFEQKYKARLKEQYGIDDDPDTFRTKREAWTRAETERDQYSQTLTALIQHLKEQEEAQKAIRTAPEDDEERLRQVAKLDPLEGAKRYFAKREVELEQKFQNMQQQTLQQSQQAQARSEGLRRAHQMVTEMWPEAFDTNTELHKAGKQIFQREMSQWEQQHPMAFLIATERAAGRLGLAPKGKRSKSSASRSSEISAQNVSRDRVKPPAETDDDTPLSPREKYTMEKMGVDEKTYRAAKKNRQALSKKGDD